MLHGPFEPSHRSRRLAVSQNWGSGVPRRIQHLVSARGIDADAVDEFCRAAEAFELGLASIKNSVGKKVALLFFQPSTRTRMGFEAATAAVGAHTIGMEDMSASRSNARSGVLL
jgi:aspartate carbamoyltransferase catalytic subunit